MKKHWLIQIKYFDPYPREYSERIEAGKMGLAIKRAVDHLQATEFKRRRLPHLTISASKI